MDKAEPDFAARNGLAVRCLRFPVVLATALACGFLINSLCDTNRPPSSPPTSADRLNSVVWGKADGHLQLACLSDDSAAVIHCYVRNAGPTFLPCAQDHLSGYWEHVSLMVLYGKDRLTLDRKPDTLRPIIGFWAPTKEKVVVKPYEILKASVFGKELSFCRFRYENRDVTSRSVIGKPLSTLSPPSAVPATFQVDLLDFNWPDYLLRETNLILRVSAFDLQSPTFAFDVRQLRLDLESVNTNTPLINIRAAWQDYLKLSGP